MYAPSTTISGSGSYSVSNGANWTQTPSSGAAALDDPMSGKGQPPIPTVANEVPVPGGVINSTICPSGICSPGKYYATITQSCGNGCTQQVASGDPLVVSGTVHFAACSGCNPTTSFGGYVFFGGLTSSGGGATVTFSSFLDPIVSEAWTPAASFVREAAHDPRPGNGP